MSCFKFGVGEIISKDLCKKEQITDIFKIDVNKAALSDRVSCNNGKDWWYIVGYQIFVETIISLFTKTPKNIFSNGAPQHDKD